MLSKRIIPTILMKRRQLVQGKQFAPNRVVGNVMQAARIHAARQVDEILMLDVTATLEDREPDYDMIQQLTQTAFVPVTVGGGIMDVSHARKLLGSGADKVALGCMKFSLIYQIASKFGSQAVAVTVPYKKGDRVADMCLQAQASGAGEIILQSIDREGTMDGYDHDSIALAASTVTVPLVAAGGCSGYQDMKIALEGGADAVSAGTLYLFTGATPRGAAEYLAEAGVEVRLAG